ncbi:MAG: hypothetical protein D6732_21370 [Methanobacteriota archaeon]|nr:MAG: hypothetical protein D6732_21370 [Euryarchaeota archaeon]
MIKSGFITTLLICEECNTKKGVKIDRDIHAQKIENSKNGLVVYSTIHKCRDGYPSITNIHVDHNGDIRSRTRESFPPMKQRTKKKDTMAVPVPTIKRTYVKDDLKKILIRNMKDKSLVKIVLKSELMGIELRIGDEAYEEAEPISSVESDFCFTTLEYFDEEIPFTKQVERWLQLVANILDTLPPTNLGNLWEVLNYMQDGITDCPTEFDEHLIKRILTSHEIIVHFGDLSAEEQQKRLSELKGNLDPETAALLEKIEEIIKEKHTEDLTLRDIILLAPEEDTLKVIYLFLMLEFKKIITYEAPGITA